MPKKSKLPALAGEMRVCAELLKKGYNATIVFGNAKATDIMVFGESKNKFARVEVKSCGANKKTFMTKFYQKYPDGYSGIKPDIWVFYLPDNGRSCHGDKFFILTHEEVGELQLKVNKGGKPTKDEGADNIPLKFFDESQCNELKWDLFGDFLNSP